jgi:shikimate kinase
VTQSDPELCVVHYVEAVIVVLIGFMGAGKTTVGRLLADRLGLAFVDSDQLLESRLGRPVRDVFETEGEEYFRELEHAVIAELHESAGCVLSVGGGAVEDERTRALLRDSLVVHLRVSYSASLGRVGADGGRPMLTRPDLAEVYQRRLPQYDGVARFCVDTDGRAPGEVVELVLKNLGMTDSPATSR